MVTLLIIVNCFDVTLDFHFKNKKAADERINSKSAEKHGEFHCIRIHHSSTICDSVKVLDAGRMLSAEVPVLPLTGCDVAKCQCKFHHHEEWRAGERRGPIIKLLKRLPVRLCSYSPGRKMTGGNQTKFSIR